MSSLLLSQGDIVARGEPAKHFMGTWQGSVEIPEYFHIYLHSFTIFVLDDEDIECEICCKIRHFHGVPGWRNWQTQRTQNPPTFGSWGFDSPSRHHDPPRMPKTVNQTAEGLEVDLRRKRDSGGTWCVRRPAVYRCQTV